VGVLSLIWFVLSRWAKLKPEMGSQQEALKSTNTLLEEAG
jgi:hypothetical protein